MGEYFWDNDPGQGSGNTLVAIDGDFNQAIEQGFESNMVFPSSGNRVFNIRFKDENGNWGQVFKQTILVHDGVPQRNPTVQQAEFYWDNDPGVGNATALQSLDGNFNQALEQLIASNIDVPTQGIHVLGLRVKDENGNWSSTFSKAIMVNPALSTRNIRIQLGEYFWDNDPGQGSGNTLVAIDGDFNQAIEQGFESNMVFPSSGNRVFNIRFKDENGNWGQVFKQTILVHDGVPQRNPTVQQAEFYWDNDPGVGNATALQSLDGNFNQALEQLIASNIDVPTQGIHVLGLRVKDENGNWSSTFSKAIMVNPALSTRNIRIQLGEYFWDNDPGQGSGNTLVAIDGDFNQAIEQVFDESLDIISSGFHIFNLRVQDENGQWGDLFSKVVRIRSSINSPINYICQGDSIELQIQGNLNYSWSPNIGLNTTTGSTVIASPSSSTVYTVIGTNGDYTDTTYFYLNVLESPTLVVNETIETSCPDCIDGSIYVSVESEGSYTQYWTSYGFYSTDEDLINIPSGEYVITVENDNNCVTIDTITVNAIAIEGCMDSLACNYMPDANIDNGSCLFAEDFYNCNDECINDINNNGICDELEIYGCMDTEALNFDSDANTDDGSCMYEIWGCTDEQAYNFNPLATHDDGSCDLSCLQPLQPYTNNIIHNRVTFNWAPPTHSPSYYMIRYRKINDNEWVVISVGPQNHTPYNITSRTRFFMEPNTTYMWNIKAFKIDSIGETICQSPWSESSLFTTLPDCPNLVNLSTYTESKWVTFTANSPESDIEIWLSKGKIRELEQDSFRYVEGSSSIYKLKGNFRPATDYEWHTKAWCIGNVDEEGNSDIMYHSGWGDFNAFSTEENCNKLPINLSTTGYIPGYYYNFITMSWDTPQSGQPHHYFLELKNENTGQVWQWNNIDGSATSKTKFGLTDGEYSWKIKGSCGTNGTTWATPFTESIYYTIGGEKYIMKVS